MFFCGEILQIYEPEASLPRIVGLIVAVWYHHCRLDVASVGRVFKYPRLVKSLIHLEETPNILRHGA